MSEFIQEQKFTQEQKERRNFLLSKPHLSEQDYTELCELTDAMWAWFEECNDA